MSVKLNVGDLVVCSSNGGHVGEIMELDNWSKPDNFSLVKFKDWAEGHYGDGDGGGNIGGPYWWCLSDSLPPLTEAIKVGTEVYTSVGPRLRGKILAVSDFGEGVDYLIQFKGWKGGHNGTGCSDNRDCWWVYPKEITRVVTPIDGTVDSPSVKPSFNHRAARATQPVNRKVLRHLKVRGSISPMEAMTIYGISRLAPAIHDLRSAGHQITTDIRKDEAGHRYARYFLPMAA